MRHRRSIPTVMVVLLLIAGCASADPTISPEYQALQQELVQAETQIAAISAERDAMAQSATPSDRRRSAARIQQELIAVLDDPEAYGSEAEIVDLLATHATATAKMDDDVFGAVNYRTGFYNTLYGMADAELDVYDHWLCDDGSQGGFLWRWHGTNNAGNPFDLPGLSLNTYDEAGLIEHELVTYPYPDEYVREAFMGSGN